MNRIEQLAQAFRKSKAARSQDHLDPHADPAHPHAHPPHPAANAFDSHLAPAHPSHLFPKLQGSELQFSPVPRAERIPHTLLVPLHYEPNYAYPLLIWLHDPGDSEKQLHQLMPLVSMRNYAAVAPRGVVTEGKRISWGDTETHLDQAEARVFRCVELAQQRLHVHPDRVFLAGAHAGGTMALRIALRNPNQFAGAVSLGGPFPLGKMPLARLSDVRDLPLFLASARDSKCYPVDRTCEELRLFHTAGMHATIRQYPGDYLPTQTFSDLDNWLMGLITGNGD